VATDAALRRAARLFMDAGGPATEKGARKKGSARRAAAVPAASLANVRRAGARQAAAIVARRRLPFPVYFPAKATQQARPAVEDARPKPYTLRDRADRRHRAYRLVMVESSVDGQYYGVQGTDWRTPPLLAHPTSTRVVSGRKLELFRDGNRLRFVAWRTPRAAYWVSNSLSLALSNPEMIGIARSLTRLRRDR